MRSRRTLLDLTPERRSLLSKLLKEEGVAATGPVMPSISPHDRNDRETYPLSFAQQRLWFLDHLAPANPFYNTPITIRLTFALNTNALFEAINEIVRRHEVLRTRFELVDGQPVQVIEQELPIPVTVVDLEHLPESERETEAQRFANAEAQRPFNLSTGPLIRSTLVRLAPADHLLLLTLHHIVCDGWSVGILARELRTLYKSFLVNHASPLPDLPVQYIDFALWQRNWLSDEFLETQMEYWLKQLSGLTALRLSTDFQRPPEPSFNGDFHRVEIAANLARQLRNLAKQSGVTLYMLLLAAFQVLLHRYTNQSDIVVGSPIANRTHPEIESLIGFFVNTLVMRTDVSGDPSFRTVIQRVREVALGAYDHQDVPFEMIVERLQPDRDLSRNPLFQVGFVLQNAWAMGKDESVRQGKTDRHSSSSGSMDAAQTDVPFEVERGTAIFDLAFHLAEIEGGILGGFEYSTDLFAPETIHRLGEHFVRLLENIVANPDSRLSCLRLLSQDELEQQIKTWNLTAAPFADKTCFHHLFERQVMERPEAPALCFDGRQLSYAQLNSRANQLAQHLITLGIGPGVLVLLSLDRSIDMIVALLGILKAGGAYVPLDPTSLTERQIFIVRDSGAQVIVTTSDWVAQLAQVSSVLESLLIVAMDTDAPHIATLNNDKPKEQTTADDLAYALYTSGSTGQPKGVLVQHQGLCNVVAAQQAVLGCSPGDRILQFASITFDASIFEIAMALGLGGVLCLGCSDEILPGPDLVTFLQRERISIMTVPSSSLAAIAPQPLPHLKTINVAGEVCPEELVSRWAPGRRFFNLYGPTETTIWATYRECRAGAGKPDIGGPIPNVQAFILDPHGNPMPMGAMGELHIGGVGVARGYLNRPDLTSTKFILNPFGEGYLYKTGDLARRMSDGRIDFCGRIDHQVQVRGFRIELGEIEACLQAHSAVQEGVVTPYSEKGSNPRLVAYIVPEQNQATGAESVDFDQEQILYWQNIYDNTYGQVVTPADARFNIQGWNSSYTNQPLPADEMRAWVDNAVEQILATSPRRVLEIGCGTGLILFRVAPHCESYCGTDFSRPVLQYLQRVFQQLARTSPSDGQGVPFEQVKLLQRSAEDFTDIPDGTFDIVVLNSVVQYFPSSTYLFRVIAGAARALRPGGTIYIGDVRSLPLLEVFHTSIELSKAPAELEGERVCDLIQRRMMLEQELLIAPEFFDSLPEQLPTLHAIEIQLKQGHYDNELSRFRYDVLLHTHPYPSIESASTQQWEPEWTLATLEQWLAQQSAETLHVTGIPNARVERHFQAVELLSHQPSMAVSAINAALDTTALTSIQPADVVALAQSQAYEVELHAPVNGRWEHFDVVFRGAEGRVGPHPIPARSVNQAAQGRHIANNPLQARVAQQLIPEVRVYLQDRLPDYMIPSSFWVLDSLPRTPSGKVDRLKLPAPDSIRTGLNTEFVRPTAGIEQTLAEIWSEVLRIEQVGRHDNFFELGGDSILSIQIVSRAHDAGLRFRAKQLFQHQTIAGLAAVVTHSTYADAEQDLVQGPVPLTPIQHWFFQQNLDDPHHFNQALFIPVEPEIRLDLLQQSVAKILQHHDALRMSFQSQASSWQQQNLDHSGPISIERIDLSHVSTSELNATLQQLVLDTQASLTLQGPLVRMVLFDYGPTQQPEILIIIHHLVVDNVSWRILLEDLFATYQQLVRGETIVLPAKTTSFRRWSELLQAYATRSELRAELPYWLTVTAPGIPSLPRNHEHGANTIDSIDTLEVRLSPDETKALLQDLPKAVNTQINDALLTALVQTFSHWTGSSVLLIDIEGHGREEIFDTVDLSRTVGWFTTIFPCRLDISAAPSAIDALRVVKEQLRAVPHQGIGYGVLNNLSGNWEPARQLESRHQAEIRFNYLGEVGEQTTATQVAGVRPAMLNRSPSQVRRHLIDINIKILNGYLVAEWTFSTHLHTVETLSNLAREYLDALRKLIQAAGQVDQRQYTPSDFRKARLNQQDLDKLMTKISRNQGA